MRVVFMGTPEFAVPSLERLHEAHDVVAVYTRPDAVSKRGSTPVPSAVKQRALELSLPVFEPVSLQDDCEAAALRALEPDVVVVAAYGLILPAAILAVPPSGAINVHASLLPRWRGAAPVQRAILAGDAITGVSIMAMEEGLDTGPYAMQVPVEIGDMDASTLTRRLAQLGAEALLQVLDSIVAGTVQWTPQDEADVTYAPKITRADVTPDPTLTPQQIVRMVRASGPNAPARVSIGGRGLTLIACSLADREAEPGSVSCVRGGLLLGAQGGAVLATLVKPDGRHAMPGDACGRGMVLGADTRWGPA